MMVLLVCEVSVYGCGTKVLVCVMAIHTPPGFKSPCVANGIVRAQYISVAPSD